MPNDQQPTLSELLNDALTHVPPEKQQAILNHTDTPSVLTKIVQSLVTPTDAMSPEERAKYKEATGEDINASPTTSATTNSLSEEDRIRNQAISDMAIAAATPTSQKSSYKQQSMTNGLPDLVLQSANKAIDSMHKVTGDYVRDLSAVIKAHHSSSK